MGQLAIPIALAVGAAAMMYLTRPKPPDQHGPRIEDLKVTTSAYGKPIPILRGIGRVGGNIIQSSDLIEVEHESDVSGGKGGSDSSSFTYTAEVNCLMMIGVGVIDDILRIWADGKLILDRTPGGSGNMSKAGLIWRFYHGTEDQMPDPLVEDLVGVDLAPAYRGVAYIVFERFQLADFGNRIPQLTVEYTEVSNPIETFQKLNGDAQSIISIQPRTAIDFETRKGYIIRGAPGSDWQNDDTYLVEYDIDTMQVLRKKLFSQIIHPSMDFAGTTEIPGNIYVGKYDHKIYISCGQHPVAKIIIIDPVTFTQGDFNEAIPQGTWYGQITDTYTPPDDGAPFRWERLPATGPREDMIAQRSNVHQFQSFDGYGVEVVYNVCLNGVSMAIFRYFANSESGNWYHKDDLITTMILGQDMLAPAYPGQIYFSPRQDNSYKLLAWMAVGGQGAGGNNLTFNNALTLPIHFGYAMFGPSILPRTELTASFTFTDVNPDAVSWGNIRRFIHVAIDDSCLMFVDTYDEAIGDIVQVASVRHWCVKLTDSSIVWILEVPGHGPDSASWLVGTPLLYGQPNQLGGIYKYTTEAEEIIEFDVRTGAYTAIPYSIAGPLGGYQYYDAAEDAIYTLGDDIWTKIVMGRAEGEGVPLASIITQLCGEVGLTPEDIDVSELTGPEYTVQGFQATKTASVRANLEPLQVPYTFYCVESDYKLHFRAIGSDPVATIEEDEFIPKGFKTLEERSVQEMDLPAQVSITFPDPLRDHNVNTATFRRPANPMAVMFSDNKIDVEIPVGAFFTEMKQAAEKHLYSLWNERWNYSGQLTWEYLWLNPGDEIVVNLRDGATIPQRLMSFNIGADFTTEYDSVSSDPATYVSTVQGEGGSGVIQQEFPQAVATRLFVLDLPLLFDGHAAPDGANMDYYAVASYGSTGWRGATIHKSPDNSAWGQVATTLIEAPHGVIEGTLPDDLSPWGVDDTLEIRVYMVAGKDQISSVTYEQMLAGANGFAILIGDGVAEVGQFQTVNEAEDGALLLTNILRGRRGTDVFCGDHGPNEAIVFLKPDALVLTTSPNTQIDDTFYYKGVTIAQRFQDARTLTATNYGNDLMPYMPVNLTAVVAATDIQFTWIRRTRIGGELGDLTGDVPLSEAAELYDLEIYNALGDTVLRTFSALTSPDVLYANADIITDFGSIPSSLNFKVYQISAVVGRGFSRMLTVNVES